MSIVCQFQKTPTKSGAFVAEKDGTFARFIVKQSKQGHVVVERLSENIDFRAFASDEEIRTFGPGDVLMLSGNFLNTTKFAVTKLSNETEVLFDEEHNMNVWTVTSLASEFTKKRGF